MKVSVNIIKNMNPCKNRFEDNFLIHYPNFNSNLEEFLSLDKITYDDKIWVCKKLLNKNQLVHFAILCAQSVLSIYEDKHSNDIRIKDCINYMVTIVDFSNLNKIQQTKLVEYRNAAYAAAEEADAAAEAATNAAYAAATNAADTAAIAACAAEAATNAAYAAACAATNAAYAAAEEADAAADAAAYAAYAAADTAAYAAADTAAIAACAATNAAYTAADAAARKNQQDLNLKFLLIASKL